MARYNESTRTLLSGKLARGVFAASLLLLGVGATSVCTAQSMGQGPRHRFENNQQPHLGIWLQRHGNLPPDQQERALQAEPGFNRLNPEMQAKLLDRLRQINRMPAFQRQRTLGHIEAMERLSPQARQQVRSSIQEFHTLPLDRQRMVKKAFRDLREYPPEQREAMIRSGRFQEEFSPQERGILDSILAAEPYQPVRGSGLDNGLQYGH